MRQPRIGIGAGLGRGYKNLMKTDPHIHRLSAKGIKSSCSVVEKQMAMQKIDDYVHKRTTMPMIARVGGKSKLAKKIINRIPEHTTYVEPFVGGGSIFFKKPPSQVEVINDLDKDVSLFYKATKVIDHDDVKNINMDHSKSRFEKFKESKPTNLKDQFEKTLYMNKNSWASNMKSYAPKGEGTTIKNKFPYYQMRLQDVNVHSQNFLDVIKKYDSPTTFNYLDPPYYEVSKDCYNHESLTPKDIHDAVKDIKGKFLLSYNNHPEVKKEFQNYNIKKAQTTYVLQGQADAKPKTELLISNY